jgi:hypothetical protein
MQEQREVLIGDDNLVGLSDCVVRGGILPESARELARAIMVKRNVTVEGGVYADRLEIDDGPTEFKNAVYVNRELHIKTSARELIVFRKAVASADTVAAFVMNGRVLFGADINADVVRLKNCYVGGSVYGGNVELENCVILGGAFSSGKLSLSNVMVGTFHAPEVTLYGLNYLLYPTAFSVSPMTVLPGSCLYNLALADLGALYKGDEENPESGKILMDLGADTQRTVLVDEDGSKILVNSYSVATRILASDIASPDKLENHFLLSAGALGTQLQREFTLNKANGEKSSALTIENISTFLFSVLQGKTEVRDLDGRVSFEELKRKFG